MRIPSQFNEDSLYRRGRRPDESAQSHRRLIRLVIGLALVLVLMRQAKRPEIYETFFSAPAQPGVTDQLGGFPDADGGTRPGSVDDLDLAGVTPQDRLIAGRLVEELSPTDQTTWIVVLSRWRRGERPAEIPSTQESLLLRLEMMDDISAEQRLAWASMFASLAEALNPQDPDLPVAPQESEGPLVSALLAALDDAAAARVVDGSVWRSGDFDAFYRYLDQASELSSAGIATTGVLPLLQQPDVFRRQVVRIQGAVARSQKIVAQDNAYGITAYWQLWLRPSDGADRPILAIVPEVTDRIEAVGADAINVEGPPVVMVGRFLKRLAYESSLGADLAPVVVGRILSAEVTPTQTGRVVETRQPSGSRLWMTILIACVLGFAVAAIAMWRTSVAAKRARQLRMAHRAGPDEFLQSLGQDDDSGEVDASEDPSKKRDES